MPEARSHSVQYVSHPIRTWQKMRAECTGQFESPIEPPPDPNGWFHARIVLAAGWVEVYVNGAAGPSLAVDDLGTSKNGGVALSVGNNSEGAFANLRITPTSEPGPAPESTQAVFQQPAAGTCLACRRLSRETRIWRWPQRERPDAAALCGPV